MHDTRDEGRSTLVVVAEDDAEMRCVLVGALRKDGYEVCEYERGDTLLDGLLQARARGRLPALIVADVCMPGRTGLAVLRGLREFGYSVPFVLITAFASEETLNEAIRMGASVILSKPFAIDQLRHVVGCFLPQSRPQS